MSKQKTKALSWDELANFYDKALGGRRARTLPMDEVFDWAKAQADKFYVDPKAGTIHKRILNDHPKRPATHTLKIRVQKAISARNRGYATQPRGRGAS